MAEEDCYPYLGSLEEYPDPEECTFSEEDVRTLKRIGDGEEAITSVVVECDWTDDHEICVGLTANGVRFSALWIVREFYADILYASKGLEEGYEALTQYISEYTDNLKLK